MGWYYSCCYCCRYCYCYRDYYRYYYCCYRDCYYYYCCCCYDTRSLTCLLVARVASPRPVGLHSSGGRPGGSIGAGAHVAVQLRIAKRAVLQ